ncbi:MAG: N-acetyltransferase [Ghiorsea sp.]
MMIMKEKDGVRLRAAQVQDVSLIYQLMQPFMQDDTLISRNEDDIFQHLQEFVVAEYQQKIVGVVALHVYASNLAEIRSLVVDSAAQGLGIGVLLVQQCEKIGIELGVSCIFALTYVDQFFAKLGYAVVAKESLPQKVWTVCVHCPKFSHCDEIAVRKYL